MSGEPKTRNISIKLSEELRERWADYCKRHACNSSALIRQLMEKHLAEHDK